jgi:hypothetical protein
MFTSDVMVLAALASEKQSKKSGATYLIFSRFFPIIAATPI